jgi:two-component system chemotaxis response regulator CheB
MAMDPVKISVLVADDSKVARLLLVHILESDPRICVAAVVNDGQAALDFLQDHKPDVVLMDLYMPGLDGFETTRRIMETVPVPIVICTANTDTREIAFSFRALEAGAVACLEKPVSPENPAYAEQAAHLLQTVRLMSEVKVVRRWPRSRRAASADGSKPVSAQAEQASSAARFIGMGASTGGPPVLQTILAGLDKDFPIPILIVQHIAHGFLPGLVEWLNQTTAWQVHIAAHGMVPLPGHAYLAPDEFHMGIASSGRIVLSREGPIGGLRPSVAFLFRTLAEVCGAQVVGVLLTGMGRDGAAELKLMRDAGAETIAQSKETSVIHGMPGEAIAMGAAVHVLGTEQIAGALTGLSKRKVIKKEIAS